MSKWDRVTLKFSKFKHETAKAYLVKVEGNKEIWLPKSFCRNLVINKKLGGHVAIPSWLFKEKFGYEPHEVENIYNIPEEIVAEKVEPDIDLLDV